MNKNIFFSFCVSGKIFFFVNMKKFDLDNFFVLFFNVIILKNMAEVDKRERDNHYRRALPSRGQRLFD